MQANLYTQIIGLVLTGFGILALLLSLIYTVYGDDEPEE